MESIVTLALEPPIEDLAPLGGAGVELTKRQKAAIVVRLLLAEGAKISLADLPDELQSELALQMSEMRFVDRMTLADVVDEFLAEIDREGLSFPGDLHGTLSMLDGTISAATASRLRKTLSAQIMKDPWERISGLGSERLLPTLEKESVEIAAVILSKLKVSKAAEMLNQLPGARARRISYAISQTGSIAADVVHKIGLSLANEFNVEREAAFNLGPVQRLGEILNSSQSITRDDVLAGLDDEDAEFAAEVRKAIFTFAVIPVRIDPRDIPKIVREVDAATLATAVAGATGKDQEAAEFILENISKRLSASVREEATTLGRVKKKDSEEALAAIVTIIRKMEANGQIYQITPEDEA